MVKKFLKWVWDDGIDLSFLIIGAITVGLSIKDKDVFTLLMGLWLITIPTLERKLKVLTEQGHIIVMSSIAQALKIKEDLLAEESKIKGDEAAG